jgi:hypothetical protein
VYVSNHLGIYTPFGPATPFDPEPIPYDPDLEKDFVDRWVKKEPQKLAHNVNVISEINRSQIQQCAQLQSFIKSISPYFSKWEKLSK